MTYLGARIQAHAQPAPAPAIVLPWWAWGVLAAGGAYWLATRFPSRTARDAPRELGAGDEAKEAKSDPFSLESLARDSDAWLDGEAAPEPLSEPNGEPHLGDPGEPRYE